MPTKKNKPYEFTNNMSNSIDNRHASKSVVPLLEANTALRPYNPKKKDIKSKTQDKQY